MRKDKDLAIQLRRENKSYGEIKKLLGVSKSTLSTWFRNNPESQATKRFLTSKLNESVAERIKKFSLTNKKRWEEWRERSRQEARHDFSAMKKKRLFIAGIMLYWAEGDSNPKNPLRFANTDPRMIALYSKFIKQVLEIPTKKIRIGLILYPDLSEKQCINFWSEIANIPKTQFYKTQFIRGRHPTKRLSNGICMVTLSDRRIKEKILVWVDLLSKRL